MRMNVPGYHPENIYILDFEKKLRDLGLGGTDQLRHIEQVSGAIQNSVLAHIGRLAFSSQNFANLATGRAALMEMPRAWLCSKLDIVLKGAIDSNDGWDYGRIAEFLEDFDDSEYAKFEDFCRNHPSPEIRDLL